MVAKLFRTVVALTLSALGLGCEGLIDGREAAPPADPPRNVSPTAPGDPSSPPTPTPPGNPQGPTPPTSPTSPPTPPVPNNDPIPAGVFVGPSPMASRLSHAQWENATRDLLMQSAPSGLSSAFPVDTSRGFDNDATQLFVSGALWESYQSAAESLAKTLTASAAQVAAVVPVSSGTLEARGQTFITTFGRRAFRRPLETSETQRYQSLFLKGATVYASMDPYLAGARLVVSAMLQSPNFLYRLVLPSAAKDLGGYEIASRLSFALWNSTPDDALLNAAGTNQLADAAQTTTQVKRLLSDARFSSQLTRFHSQVFDWARIERAAPSTTLWSGFTPAHIDAMKKEADLFVHYVTDEVQGGIKELLTSNVTFVDSRLAPQYGVSVAADGQFHKVTLNAAKRSGLLTQLGFLTANATATTPSIIHRGVFVNRRLLCNVLPPPPAFDANALVTSGTTNREKITSITGPGTCGAGCHAGTINPPGYALEGLDAAGKERALDNGKAVDSVATVTIDGQARVVKDGVELSAALAQSNAVRQCYARQWTALLLGRPYTDAELNWMRRLTMQDMSTRALVEALVTSPEFRTRVLEATP